MDTSAYVMTCSNTSVRLAAMTSYVSNCTVTCVDTLAIRGDVLRHVSKVGENRINPKNHREEEGS